METSTTIREMLMGNRVIVPDYQRAYSWEDKQVKTLLEDLDKHIGSPTDSAFYFGHFLFEIDEKDKEKFYVIDGQQRLTSIIIIVSVILKILEKNNGSLTDEQIEIKEGIIKQGSKVRFSTVEYDDQIFRDMIVDHKGIAKFEFESQRRMHFAYTKFSKVLNTKDSEYLNRLLIIIAQADCTTHTIKNESEAIQIFLFQNDRGKQVTKLEILKAQFMYQIHIKGGNSTEIEDLVREIKNRFKSIYKSIAYIDTHVSRISEDDMLRYTNRIFFYNLDDSAAEQKINNILQEKTDERQYTGNKNPICFIREYVHELETCFNYAKLFVEQEREVFEIHSLLTLGRIGIVFPFILKAFKFQIPIEKLKKLFSTLESIVFRQRVIGTRADIVPRINGMFQKFESSRGLNELISGINGLKEASDNWWYAYWNNEKLEAYLNGGVKIDIARFILWKYENYLLKQKNRNLGYSPVRYDMIDRAELEHIAPKTKPDISPHGYGNYTDKFTTESVNNLGNYLLISKSHNCVIGNKSFHEKRASYMHNEQQREIQSMSENKKWDSELISARKEKIVQAIMSIY